MDSSLQILSSSSCVCSLLPALPQERFGRSGNLARGSVFRSCVPIACSSSSQSTPPEDLAEEPSHPNERSSAHSPSRSNRIANFQPPPPSAPLNSETLRTELPFQYWYSYSDLPPGASKRRFRNPNAEKRPPRDDDNSASTSGKGRKNGPGIDRLWFAIQSEVDASGVSVSGSQRPPPLPGTSREGRGGPVVLSSLLEEKFRKARAFNRERELSGSEVEDAGACEADLSANDMKELIRTCEGSSRQINLGWGGWKPTYVALIHSYWKRSRVCKIVCKGLVTVDMDSTCRKLEVETGGKVIGRRGGVVYLFRGLGYDFWRDGRQLLGGRYDEPTIQIPKQLQVPPGLSKEEVTSLRSEGRELPALSRLGENGVYLTLLDDVRKAFETQHLVRVNCQGLHSRNFKSLALKLKALVPCELISFEFEHILVWRGQKSNLQPKSEDQPLVSPSHKPVQ